MTSLAVREGPGGSRWVISLMGGHDRRGRWRIAKRCTVINVTGGSHLDLCAAELAGREIELNVPSVTGGGEIRVPNGVDVQVSDVGVMGGNDVRLGHEVVAPGGPLIRIRLVSIMGAGDALARSEGGGGRRSRPGWDWASAARM
ncbi:MAG TPA: hypothetical protein VIX82_11995 [Solirubrobacteraceae bacterium]